MVYLQLALCTHLDMQVAYTMQVVGKREKVMHMLQAFQDDYFQDNYLQVVYQVIYLIIIDTIYMRGFLSFN